MNKTVKGYSLVLKDKSGNKTLKIYEVTEEGEKVCVKRVKKNVDNIENDDFKNKIKEILKKMEAVDNGVNYVAPVNSNDSKDNSDTLVSNSEDNKVNTTTPIQNGPNNQENDNLNYPGIKNIQNYVIEIFKSLNLRGNNNSNAYYDKILEITNEILDKKYVEKEKITEDYFNQKLNIIFILFCKMVINYDEKNNTSELINNDIDDYLKNLIKEYEKDYNSENTVFKSELLNLLNQKYDNFIKNMNNNNLPKFDKLIDGKQFDGKIFAQDGQY